MNLRLPVLILLILTVVFSEISIAAPIKIHVSAFNVSGVPNSQELKLTLQEILTSRLNPAQVQLVEKPEQAELLVIGSYAQFGKMFSLDARISDKGSDSLTKVFEQGEGQEDVIPALGRLALKITGEVAKRQTVAVPAAPKPPLPVVLPPPVVTTEVPVKETFAIRSEPSVKNTTDGWTSAPIDGVFSSLAVGRTRAAGEREIFVAGEHGIRIYLSGSELKLVSEIAIPVPARILTIDTADLNKDGVPELYVSIIDRGVLASRVYQFNGTTLVLSAENLPWFFRGVGHNFSSRTIYTQEMIGDDKYYGDVKELSWSGERFTALNPLKLPRSGNIFNFSRLGGLSDKNHFVVLDGDGYLAVFSSDGTEVWKSSEKYGGSETYLKNDSQSHVRSTGDLQRWVFLEQRMTLLKDGTLLVPYNEGTFSIGNNRAFNKHTLFSFEWTGTVLKEKWHSRKLPSYLADYAFDQATEEIIQLEVVQKSGLFAEGRSALSINKIH